MDRSAPDGRHGLVLVILSVLAVVALHLFVRGAISDSLITLDALENVNSQTWQLVYKADAPPLFNWLHTLFAAALGPTWFAISLLRYLLLLLYFVFLYLSARRIVRTDYEAALFALSASALYQVGWAGQEYVTHSALLLAALAVTLWAFLRTAEEPSTPNYLLFGGVLGVGLLSKYNFPAFPLLLFIAALPVPSFRPAVLSPKLLLSIGIALMFLAPVLLWNASEGWPVLGEASEHITRHRDDTGPGVLERLGTMAGAFVGYFLPLALILPVIFRGKLFRPVAPASDYERLFRNLIILGLAASLVGAIAGAANFQERYMHPLLFFLPLYFAARLARSRIDPRQMRTLGYALICLAALVFIIRMAQLVDASSLCGERCRPMEPFDRLAERIRAENLVSDTYVTDDIVIAGNLRAHFPHSRALTFDAPLIRTARADQQSCLLVYRGERAERMLGDAPVSIVEQVRAGPVVDLTVSWPHLWRPENWRTSDFRAVRLDPSDPACVEPLGRRR